MTGLVALYGGSAPHHRSLHEPKYARWFDRLIYLPDLPRADLSGVDGVVIPERLHRGLLQAGRHVLLDLLDRGGTVVIFGDQSIYGDTPDGWLPGIRWEHRPTNYWWWRDAEPHSGLVAAAPDHGLFRHLTLADMTWHQHGVFRPPHGAETVLATDDGGAVLYVDQVSTPGTLVVTSLDPLYHFGSYFMPATERFLDGFLPWLVTDLLARVPSPKPPPHPSDQGHQLTTTLDVLDQGNLVSFSFDDLLKYHGLGFIGGVAHGFKALERALPLLAEGKPPERREITVETAFPGPGARDVFELVTRAVTGDRYVVDLELGGPDVIASAKGRYFFRLEHRGTTVEVKLREGMVVDEFIELSRRGATTPEDLDRLQWLKQDMADRMLALPADQVYDAEVRTP